MNKIALALLSVWLCFYQVYRIKNWLDTDSVASLISLLSAIKLLV